MIVCQAITCKIINMCRNMVATYALAYLVRCFEEIR